MRELVKFGLLLLAACDASQPNHRAPDVSGEAAPALPETSERSAPPNSPDEVYNDRIPVTLRVLRVSEEWEGDNQLGTFSLMTKVEIVEGPHPGKTFWVSHGRVGERDRLGAWGDIGELVSVKIPRVVLEEDHWNVPIKYVDVGAKREDRQGFHELPEQGDHHRRNDKPASRGARDDR